MLAISTQIAQEDSLSSFARLLQSASFASEIIIFNMERTDPEFMRLAHKYQAKVIPIKTPAVVEFIRDQQLKAPENDWVLVLDFDEVITQELKAEINELVKGAPATYALKRRNFSLGFSLQRGGFGDDYVPRLFHRSLFLSWPHEIHSLPKVKGDIKRTSSYLEHHKDESLELMVDKTNRYSGVEATQFFEGGLRINSPLTLLRKWWMESFRRGILKAGLIDGKIGLLQAIYQGFSVFISYAKLYEKQLTTPPAPPSSTKLP
jgi:hypothetical protein